MPRIIDAREEISGPIAMMKSKKEEVSAKLDKIRRQREKLIGIS